jgi:hypothetical protein
MTLNNEELCVYITPHFAFDPSSDLVTEVLIFQTERVRDAAWGCDWVGTPIRFQKCIRLMMSAANKQFTLTAGKFVPVSVTTMVNVRLK